MPNCFRLIDKQTKEPALLTEVDDRMRRELGEPADPDEWLYNWYNTIGFGMAMGHSSTKLREIFDGCKCIKALDWLEKNYDSESWAER